MYNGVHRILKTFSKRLIFFGTAHFFNEFPSHFIQFILRFLFFQQISFTFHSILFYVFSFFNKFPSHFIQFCFNFFTLLQKTFTFHSIFSTLGSFSVFLISFLHVLFNFFPKRSSIFKTSSLQIFAKNPFSKTSIS